MQNPRPVPSSNSSALPVIGLFSDYMKITKTNPLKIGDVQGRTLNFSGFSHVFFHGPIMFLGQKTRAEPRRSPAVAPPRPGATSPFWQSVGKPWENPWRTDGIPSGYLT